MFVFINTWKIGKTETFDNLQFVLDFIKKKKKEKEEKLMNKRMKNEGENWKNMLI